MDGYGVWDDQRHWSAWLMKDTTMGYYDTLKNIDNPQLCPGVRIHRNTQPFIHIEPRESECWIFRIPKSLSFSVFSMSPVCLGTTVSFE